MNLKPLPIPWKPIYPSQRAGLPSLDRGFWQGEERRFVLQWCEDRVYFQLFDGEPTLWATLDECREDEMFACWDEALRARRIGTCCRCYPTLERTSFYTTLHLIAGMSGECRVREWFNRHWHTFIVPESRTWALFPDLWMLQKSGGFRFKRSHPLHISLQGEDLEWALLSHRFTDEEIDHLSFRASSDEVEWRRVMRCLRILGLCRAQHIFLSTGTGNEFRESLDLSSNWRGSPELHAYLESYFWIQGCAWHRTGWGRRQLRRLRRREPHLRLFIEPISVYWQTSWGPCEPASFHEQLEARFELGDWLRARIPDANIETWLAPHHQT